MDEEKFRIEVLNRLDKIISLLTISCSMSKAALERSQPAPPKPQTPAAGQDDTSAASRQYLIGDEMRDDYDQAVQKWKTSKGV